MSPYVQLSRIDEWKQLKIGPAPMLRIVGSDVTATGTLTGLGDLYGAEYAFEMAANCD